MIFSVNSHPRQDFGVSTGHHGLGLVENIINVLLGDFRLDLEHDSEELLLVQLAASVLVDGPYKPTRKNMIRNT